MSSKRRWLRALRSRWSTGIPTHSLSNCPGTPHLSRRSSPRVGEQTFGDRYVVCVGHFEVSLLAAEGTYIEIGVLLDARRRVGAFEPLAICGVIGLQQRQRLERLRCLDTNQSHCTAGR